MPLKTFFFVTGNPEKAISIKQSNFGLISIDQVIDLSLEMLFVILENIEAESFLKVLINFF